MQTTTHSKAPTHAQTQTLTALLTAPPPPPPFLNQGPARVVYTGATRQGRKSPSLIRPGGPKRGGATAPSSARGANLVHHQPRRVRVQEGNKKWRLNFQCVCACVRSCVCACVCVCHLSRVPAAAQSLVVSCRRVLCAHATEQSKTCRKSQEIIAPLSPPVSQFVYKKDRSPCQLDATTGNKQSSSQIMVIMVIIITGCAGPAASAGARRRQRCTQS